jgi:hypothetical protein
MQEYIVPGLGDQFEHISDLQQELTEGKLNSIDLVGVKPGDGFFYIRLKKSGQTLYSRCYGESNAYEDVCELLNIDLVFA